MVCFPSYQSRSIERGRETFPRYNLMNDTCYPEEIKRMVEECGAKFAAININKCTHLVTTEKNANKDLRKS